MGRSESAVELDTMMSYDILDPIQSLPPMPSIPTAHKVRKVNCKDFLLGMSVVVNIVLLICFLTSSPTKPDPRIDHHAHQAVHHSQPATPTSIHQADGVSLHQEHEAALESRARYPDLSMLPWPNPNINAQDSEEIGLGFDSDDDRDEE
ncbi:hypothetical protein AAMO2058_000746500 [Amorphochlora amoebiformis]